MRLPLTLGGSPPLPHWSQVSPHHIWCTFPPLALALLFPRWFWSLSDSWAWAVASRAARGTPRVGVMHCPGGKLLSVSTSREEFPQGLRLFSLAPCVVLLWDLAEFVQQAATVILRDPRKVLL